MGAYYLIYGLAVAMWVYSDAKLKSASKWWAPTTFIMPLFLPYYLSETRTDKSQYWKCMRRWLGGYFLVHMTGFMMTHR